MILPNRLPVAQENAAGAIEARIRRVCFDQSTRTR